MAETRKEAEEAFDMSMEKYQAKYLKAVNCLKKTGKISYPSIREF